MKKERKSGKIANAALKWTIDIVIIIFGGAVYSLGVHCFTAPNDIAPGGVTGIATIISKLTGLPIGILILVINLPLIIIGFILLHKNVMIKTLIGVATLTVMTDYVFANVPQYVAEQGNGILASIFGGLIMGLGLGIVYMREGTTGGTDIVVKIITKYNSNFKIGSVTLILDAAVVVMGYIVYQDLNVILFTIIAIAIQSYFLDFLVYGKQESRFLMIFSNKYEEISEALLLKNRGVTFLEGEGAYSGSKRRIIVTAIHKSDYVKVKRIIREVDPCAFVIVTRASEVLGEGFQELR